MEVMLRKITVAIVLASLTVAQSSHAMSSNSYKIESDSINFGGARSSSPTYTLEDTAGEVGTGGLTSSNYHLNAGYQQMTGHYLALTPSADVPMSPAINGLTGGDGEGSASWNVTTDNPAGYTLQIRSQNSPALGDGQGNGFSDYSPGAVPSFNWSISSLISAFGFSVQGPDADQRYLNDGASCGTGALNTSDRCWDGFSTSNKVVSKRNFGNHPEGTETTVKFRAEVGSQGLQTNGVYSAVVIVTAIPQ